MFVSAIDARSTEPLPCTTAATATVAQSWARRFIFVYDQPAEPSFGTRISTSISSGSSAVCQTPGEELAGRNRPIALRAPGHELAVERENHRRQIGGGIAVGERAADRASMTDLRVADLPGRVGDDRTVLPEGGCRGDVLVPRQRADRDRVPFLPDVRQIADTADVDQERRPGDAELHRRDERVPTGEQLRVLPLREELDRVIGMLGDDVVEPCRDHRATSSIAVQTRSGVAGSCTSVTPRCERASTTALMTAGAAAIVPVSPTPFTPSGLSAAVAVRSVS